MQKIIQNIRLKFSLIPFILWVSTLLIVYKNLGTKLYDPDLWWHLATARELLEAKRFLRVDIFSHTLYGHEWINFEWLSQGVFLLVAKSWGFEGLYDFKVMLGLMSLGMLLLILWQARLRGPLLFLLFWLGFFVMRPRLHERPEAISLILFPLLVLFVLYAREHFTRFVRRYGPWLVFILMIIWANCHAGFVYGVGFLILFYWGARLSKGKREYSSFVGRLIFFSMLGSLINPHGLKIMDVFQEHLFQLFQGSNLIQEWEPPRDHPAFWPLYLLCGFFLVRTILKKRKEDYIWLPAVFTFAVWGALAYRNTSYLAIVAFAFVAGILKRATLPTQAAYLLWLAGLFPIAINAKGVTKPPLPEQEVVAWNRFPKDISQFILATNIQGTMFNTYGFGGFLEWFLGPERRVFIDGRYIFYPLIKELQTLIDEFQKNPTSDPWRPYFDKYKVDYAIVDYSKMSFSESELPFRYSLYNFMFPRNAWALVFWDDYSLLFLKRIPRFEPLIKEYEYKMVTPYNFEQMRYFLKSGFLTEDMVLQELTRHRAQVNQSYLRSLMLEMVSEIKGRRKGAG